jgi:hypothetical protein
VLGKMLDRVGAGALTGSDDAATKVSQFADHRWAIVEFLYRVAHVPCGESARMGAVSAAASAALASELNRTVAHLVRLFAASKELHKKHQPTSVHNADLDTAPAGSQMRPSDVIGELWALLHLAAANPSAGGDESKWGRGLWGVLSDVFHTVLTECKGGEPRDNGGGIESSPHGRERSGGAKSTTAAALKSCWGMVIWLVEHNPALAELPGALSLDTWAPLESTFAEVSL